MNIYFLGFFIFFSSVLFSFVSTWLFIRFVPAGFLSDIPNHRSLHEKPVLRGGGVSIVLAFLLALIFCTVKEFSVFRGLWTGLLVAIVGFLDDLKGVTAKKRLFVHAVSVILFLWLQKDHLSIPLFDSSFLFDFSAWNQNSLFIFNFVFLSLLMIWMINLFNFMDGIDGIAGIESFSVALIVFFFCIPIFKTFGYSSDFLFLLLVLGGSSLGFLIFNWSPARVFLGDVGSGFLGFVFSALAVVGILHFNIPLYLFLIPLGYFITDSTLTLLKRLARGVRVTEAHREHFYQKLVSERRFSHSRTSLMVLAINFLLLAPLTFLFYQYALNSIWALTVLFFVFGVILAFVQSLSAK